MTDVNLFITSMVTLSIVIDAGVCATVIGIILIPLLIISQILGIVVSTIFFVLTGDESISMCVYFIITLFSFMIIGIKLD